MAEWVDLQSGRGVNNCGEGIKSERQAFFEMPYAESFMKVVVSYLSDILNKLISLTLTMNFQTCQTLNDFVRIDS